MLRWLALALAVAVGCSSPTESAQPSRYDAASLPAGTAAYGLLQIDGDAGQRQMSSEDLRKLGTSEVEWNHKGKTRRFTAVPLESVLREIGLAPGPMEAGAAPAAKRPLWKYAGVATAPDGFQAVFSVAEVFTGMGCSKVYVALAADGGPLDSTAGPLRLLVPTDGEGSRSGRNLARLTVVDLRRVVPAN